MTMKEFVDTIFFTDGDLGQLCPEQFNEFMQKAEHLKALIEKRAEENQRRREIISIVRHVHAIEEIKDLMHGYVAFTPTQVQLAAISVGETPKSYQYYARHLIIESNNPEGQVKRVFGNISYQTLKYNTNTRNVSGGNNFYKFID